MWATSMTAEARAEAAAGNPRAKRPSCVALTKRVARGNRRVNSIAASLQATGSSVTPQMNQLATASKRSQEERGQWCDGSSDLDRWSSPLHWRSCMQQTSSRHPPLRHCTSVAPWPWRRTTMAEDGRASRADRGASSWAPPDVQATQRPPDTSAEGAARPVPPSVEAVRPTTLSGRRIIGRCDSLIRATCGSSLCSIFKFVPFNKLIP